MANSSIHAAFERMWQHIVAKIGTKADADHNHDDIYCVKEELDNAVQTVAQELTDGQKAQARENIDAISGWNEMSDKPFGEIPMSDTITWDGNRDGLIRADDYDQYLVSTATPTLADFENGASNTKLLSGTESTSNLGMGTAIYEAGDGCIVVGNSVVALRDGATMGNTTYPKKGVYFTWIGNDSYTTSLTINGYTGFPILKKIDSEYMPDDLVFALEDSEDIYAEVINADTFGGKAPEEYATQEEMAALTAEDVGARPNTWLPTIEEIGAAPAVESAEHIGCFYRTVNGVTEWVNPPMEVDVEYCTTERWAGKAVYRKILSYKTTSGWTTSTGNVSIPHGISNINTLIEVNGVTSSYFLPYVSGSTTSKSHVTINGWSGTNITLSVSSDWSAGRTWYFHMKYTKN